MKARICRRETLLEVCAVTGRSERVGYRLHGISASLFFFALADTSRHLLTIRIILAHVSGPLGTL